MPLKLADITHSSSTSLLNKWADEKDQTLQKHESLIKTLQQQILNLQKAAK